MGCECGCCHVTCMKCPVCCPDCCCVDEKLVTSRDGACDIDKMATKMPSPTPVPEVMERN